MNNNYEKLLEEVKLKNGVVLKNRLVLSPMTTNSSTKEGYITLEDIDYAKRRANSASLQVTGAAYIEKFGQLFEYGFSIDRDECIDGLKKLACAMKKDGNKAIIQLTHAGRFSNQAILNFKKVYGPSGMHLHSPIEHEVLEMSKEKIKSVIEDYKKATSRAIKAGFDGVEVSAAQRLLIQTFFSKYSNKRSDEYGSGTLENRSRFCLEVMSAVREVIDKEADKNFIFGYRATPEETRGIEIGYDVIEFNKHIDMILEVANIDYLAIASWGHDIYKNKVRSNTKYKGEYVNKIVYKHLAKRIPLISSGGINSISSALDALKYSDMVGMSSVFVAEPDFLQKLEENKIEEINLNITLDKIEDLKIPKAAFKDIVRMMDYGESLPKNTRDELRKLEKNY